ncbi:unnamed protein product [Closterium sp. NIES-54]
MREAHTRYTMVFPLRSKGEVHDVLIPWIRAARLQLHERFREDLPVLRLHSDRGVMEVARTSMIHAAAPHYQWPFAVRYVAHQLNLGPRVSLSETSPTLRWMGKVGDASVFRVWGCRAFVRNMSADKLSARAIPCGLAPSGVPQVDSVEPVVVAVDSGAAGGGATRGAASGGAEPVGAGPGGTESACTEPGVAESESADSERAEPGGAELGGVELERAEPGGNELGGAEPERAEPGGAEPERAEPGGTLSNGGPAGALSRREPLSPLQLREWFARRTHLRSGAVGFRGSAVGGTGASCPGGNGTAGVGGPEGAGAGGTEARAAEGTGAAGTRAGATGGTRVGAAGGTGAAGPGGARTGGTRAAGAGGAAGVGAGDPGAGDTGAGGIGLWGAGIICAGSRDTGRPRPYFVPLLQQPASPLPAPPYNEQTGGLTERSESLSRPALPVCAVRTGRRVPRQRPPPIPGTHHVALRPSSVPQRVPLPSTPASSLSNSPDPEYELVRTASPTVPHLLAIVVTDPSFESATAYALVAELVDFAAACRLDYAASLVAESDSGCPPSVGGECAFGTDVLEDGQKDFECFAAAVPHLVSMLIALEGDPDAPDIPTPRSYAEAITGPYSSQ